MTAPRYRWQPTTAEIAARYGIRPSDVVRFDHNTSPFTSDWAPQVTAPLAQHLNEYPGASYAPLRSAAAAYVGVEQDWVVPGAGVDEIILLIAKAFLRPGSRSVAATPTYPLYEIATRQHDADFLGVPYRSDFTFPSEQLADASETAEVTWICVPNNPTGDRPPDDDIRAVIAAAKGLVVIDAAYAEFTEDRWAGLVRDEPHVIVMHTLSKAFGLAALRVGFAVAHPAVIDQLDGIRPPGSVSTMSAELAQLALENPQRMARHVTRIIKERAVFATALSELGIAVVPDSHTNFVLCHVGDRAAWLAGDLMTEGLVVRSFPASGPLAEFLRFTVRSPSQNERLVDALARRLRS